VDVVTTNKSKDIVDRGQHVWAGRDCRLGDFGVKSRRRISIDRLKPVGMSALGQKRTFAPQKVMSALPPKADMCCATRNVRFVPMADIANYSITSSACNNIEDDTARPSAPAVLTFIAISNLTGTWTGKSAGLLPRSTRST
jgi:hypothetical protein